MFFTGGNASGDKKLKMMVINNSLNPRALNGHSKSKLGVIFKCGGKSAWMNSGIFRDWFDNHFVPTVKQYQEEKGLSSKALLLLDNAPVHPKDLPINHPHIKVVFMPPNCSCLIQPMDQAVIKCLKAAYIQRTASLASQSNSKDELLQFWNSFNIKNCIDNLVVAWDSIRNSTMKRAWSKVLPEWCRDEKNDEDLQQLNNWQNTVASSSSSLGRLVQEWTKPDVDNVSDYFQMTEEQLSRFKENDDGQVDVTNTEEKDDDHSDQESVEEEQKTEDLLVIDAIRDAIFNKKLISVNITIKK